MYDFRAAGIGRDPDGRPDLAKPSLVLTAGEAFRIPCEYAGSLVLDTLTPFADEGLGQGRPVLVVPGFHATDTATRRLRGHLRAARLGRLRLGRRHQPRPDRRGARRRAGPLRRGPRRPPGAGEPGRLELRRPAGPLAGPPAARERPPGRHPGLAVASGGRTHPDHPDVRALAADPRPLRARRGGDRRAARAAARFSTSVWSRTDGIVPWRGCALDDGPMTENIAVPSSHIGLVSNPLALAVVTDRLAQDPESPVPFSWRRTDSGWRRDRQGQRSRAVTGRRRPVAPRPGLADEGHAVPAAGDEEVLPVRGARHRPDPEGGRRPHRVQPLRWADADGRADRRRRLRRALRVGPRDLHAGPRHALHRRSGTADAQGGLRQRHPRERAPDPDLGCRDDRLPGR